jgi:hypothetical protein
MTTDHAAAEPPEHNHPPPAQTASLEPDPSSLADVIERLAAEFEPALSRTAIALTVRHCHRELDIIHGEALSELVERLARRRLRATVSTRGNQQSARQPRHPPRPGTSSWAHHRDGETHDHERRQPGRSQTRMDRTAALWQVGLVAALLAAAPASSATRRPAPPGYRWNRPRCSNTATHGCRYGTCPWLPSSTAGWLAPRPR